jgi:hypothetical protein
MIPALDSATPPTAAQAAAARASGIAVWSGYIATRPELGVGPVGSRFGLFRPWRQAEFGPVKTLRGTPLAYASGWDSPAGCKALAAAWGVRLCLDVEGGIRGDGPWVQGWLDASGAGLYGTQATHVNRRAAFHIAAWYLQKKDPNTGRMVPIDPGATWPANWPRPAGLCGWQWQNTHTEFGVGVDRCWFDDGFAGKEDDDMTRGQIVFDFMVAQVLAFGEIDPNPASQQAFVAAVEGGANPNDIFAGWYNSPQSKAYRARLTQSGKPPAFDATITPK